MFQGDLIFMSLSKIGMLPEETEKNLIYAFSVGKEMATQHLSNMFDSSPLARDGCSSGEATI